MTLIREADHGTPASHGPDLVSVTIDGENVTVPAGTSIMRAESSSLRDTRPALRIHSPNHGTSAPQLRRPSREPLAVSR